MENSQTYKADVQVVIFEMGIMKIGHRFKNKSGIPAKDVDKGILH
jgi:hypothetical protein